MTDNPTPQAPQDSVIVPKALLEELATFVSKAGNASLHREIFMLLPKPIDPARELLARAMEAVNSLGDAHDIRKGGTWPEAVEVIREGMKPRMTPEVELDLGFLGHAAELLESSAVMAAFNRIAAAFQDEAP